MSFFGRVGGFLQSRGENLVIKELESKYGFQIGKVANNGNKTFIKQVRNGTTTTGLTWDNKVISEVTHRGDNIKGTTKKIKYNRDGDIVEVSHSRRATNYRNNVTENLETGEVKSNVLTYGEADGHLQHQVTTRVIDSHGKINSFVRDVKINGKNYATEQV